MDEEARCRSFSPYPVPLPQGEREPKNDLFIQMQTALIALCGGAYRLSQRRIASFCVDVLGVPLALGEICQVEQTVARALDPAVQKA